jgi:hypothetical protein
MLRAAVARGSNRHELFLAESLRLGPRDAAVELRAVLSAQKTSATAPLPSSEGPFFATLAQPA